MKIVLTATYDWSIFTSRKFNRIKKIILVSSITLGVIACKKKGSSTSTATSSDPCKGNNLCFVLDGVQKSQTAKWRVITGSKPRNRIYWEEGSGASYKNIEIDIYGDSVGTYSIVAVPNNGQAGFQYYETTGPINIQGVSGTLNVTKNDGTKLSGTFSLIGNDGSKTHEIKEGNFVQVPN